MSNALVLTDENGDLRVDSVCAGQPQAAWPFGAYREQPDTNPDVTDRGYTGHRMNNTGANDLGLIYMQARFYAPELRRFISADTIVPQPGNPQAFNRYAYVYNDAVNLIDPTGHFTEDAVYDYILEHECSGAQYCADNMYEQWQQDSDWWAMLMAAEAGDMLYGAFGAFSNAADGQFYYEFQGHKSESLTGITRAKSGGTFPFLDDMSLGFLRLGSWQTTTMGNASYFAYFPWGDVMSASGSLIYDRVVKWAQPGLDGQSGFDHGAAAMAFTATLSEEILKDALCGNVPGCGPIVDASLAALDAGNATSFTAAGYDLNIDTYGRTWTKRSVKLVVNYQSGGIATTIDLGLIVVNSQPNRIYR